MADRQLLVKCYDNKMVKSTYNCVIFPLTQVANQQQQQKQFWAICLNKWISDTSFNKTVDLVKPVHLKTGLICVQLVWTMIPKPEFGLYFGYYSHKFAPLFHFYYRNSQNQRFYIRTHFLIDWLWGRLFSNSWDTVYYWRMHQ